MRAVVFEAEWAPRAGHVLTERERAERKAMGSRVWRRPTFGWREVEEAPLRHGEVRLRVRACGVCGSDTHCYETDEEGYILFSGPVRAPVVCGHEYAAEVVEVGPGVRRLSRGQLVVGEGMLGCGVCEACRVGSPNQCPSLEMLGFSAPGAFAERLVAEERFLWPIDPLAEAMGDAQAACERAALVEPIGCAYNGMFVSAGGFRPGGHVAVFGCGPIGLGAIALARAAGAATVVAFEVSAGRRAVAATVGADEVWDPREVAAHEAIRAASRGWGADMIVEAAGAAIQTMPSIEQSFAPGGRMVYLGRTGLRAPVMLDVLVTQAAGIVGARGHSGGGCFPRILRLLERGRLSVDPVITRRVGMEGAVEAIAASRDREQAKIMVVAG